MGPGYLKKRKKLLKVAITGIFGSGKSTVTSIFRKEGIPVISCDEIVHQLLEKKEVAGSIEKAFGRDVVSKGRIDRRKLGSIVFADKASRLALEKLIHPEVFREIERIILDYNGKSGIIVIEIPLLFETKSENLFSKVIVVTASPEKIKKRLKEQFKEEEIEDRWHSQIPLEQKERKADYCIDNSGSLQDTVKQVRLVIKKLTKR